MTLLINQYKNTAETDILSPFCPFILIPLMFPTPRQPQPTLGIPLPQAPHSPVFPQSPPVFSSSSLFPPNYNNPPSHPDLPPPLYLPVLFPLPFFSPPLMHECKVVYPPSNNLSVFHKHPQSQPLCIHSSSTLNSLIYPPLFSVPPTLPFPSLLPFLLWSCSL